MYSYSKSSGFSAGISTSSGVSTGVSTTSGYGISSGVSTSTGGPGRSAAGGSGLGIGAGMNDSRDARKLILAGDLAPFALEKGKAMCPGCGHECDVYSYHRFPGALPSIECLDCDCGYLSIVDRITDDKDTSFIRRPGLPGTVLIGGETEEIILTGEQTQRIVETRLVYAKRVEGKFIFTDSNHKQAACHIEQIGNLVIATELKENKGMSVTNSCEVIAEKHAEAAGIVLENLIFVERYDERSPGYSKPSLDRVSFKIVSSVHRRLLREPNWTRITEEELDNLKRKSLF